MAKRLRLPVEVGIAEQLTGSPADSSEAAARDARYAFFKETVGRVGARYLLTAHTADDQAETILHRIIRGTSIRGAAGIRRARPLLHGVALLRPLLKASHDEILTYLHARNQAFCEDETNAESRYLRNRIRHELLPLLEAEYQTGARESLLRFGRLAEEASEVLADLVAEVLPSVAECRAGCVRLRSQPFASLRPHLARLILMECWRHVGWPERDMSFAKWEWLRTVVAPQSSHDPLPALLPGSVRVSRNGDEVVLTLADST